MSQLTLANLLEAEAARFLSAAGAWRELAGIIDAATEDLITVGRDLPEAWESGVGAKACRTTVTLLRSQVDAAYVPCGAIATALDTHGYAINDLRTAAERIMADARGRGFAVDLATSTVSAEATLKPYLPVPSTTFSATRTPTASIGSGQSP